MDGGRRWRRGRRPPWWPEDEPWPPRHRPPWLRPHGPPPVGCLIVAISVVVLIGLAIRTPALAGVVVVGAVAAALVFLVAALLATVQLRRLAHGTRQADRRRKIFLADVAHEFRTPLSVIRGQAEALADGIYPADAAHVAPIVESVRTIERLVDDLRTLSQSEAGALELRREPVDLRSLASEVAAGFAAEARAAGIELEVRGADGLPAADADPARVRSVLSNLLANAVRHTPARGRVEIVVSRSGAHLVVAVEDTGTGVDPELLPRVFDRFVKGEGSPGSGLGLAIARDLVGAHGGEIDLTQRDGGGTAVRFTLPVESP